MQLDRKICLVNAGSISIVEMLKYIDLDLILLYDLSSGLNRYRSRFPILSFHRICGTSLDGLAARSRDTNAATERVHSSDQESRPKPRFELSKNR
jgi:hypothetical protein